MGLHIDFTDVPTSQPLPTSDYHVKITGGELRPSKSTPGAQYINWEFTIQDGEFTGRKVWANTSLQPQALFVLKGLLEALGQDATQALEFEIEDFLGYDLVVKVGPQKGDPDQIEVKKFKPYDTESVLP